jgi:hypothetical protein
MGEPRRYYSHSGRSLAPQRRRHDGDSQPAMAREASWTGHFRQSTAPTDRIRGPGMSRERIGPTKASVYRPAESSSRAAHRTPSLDQRCQTNCRADLLEPANAGKPALSPHGAGGSTTADYFWMPPAPVLNSRAAFVLTPSIAPRFGYSYELIRDQSARKLASILDRCSTKH